MQSIDKDDAKIKVFDAVDRKEITRFNGFIDDTPDLKKYTKKLRKNFLELELSVFIQNQRTVSVEHFLDESILNVQIARIFEIKAPSPILSNNE
ncbi:hypothetical protein HUJ05_001352 [Dendroctonus ponderosae]|nr:hypothetical protein HUJ05_001352 [Dendroctonus ponderosae]